MKIKYESQYPYPTILNGGLFTFSSAGFDIEQVEKEAQICYRSNGEKGNDYADRCFTLHWDGDEIEVFI